MTFTIPFVDLKAQYKTIEKEIHRAIEGVLDSTQFIQGDQVGLFEKNFATYIGAKHCVTVNSGTDALILGMRALGLKEGDEVIVPNNTFYATALGVVENRLKLVLVDTNDAFGINLEDLEKKITKKTKAVIVVHLYGQPDNILGIHQLIKKKNPNILLIEDAAQAHGAKVGGLTVGVFGVFAAFSFYPGKNLGAYGDGGALTTNDQRLDAKLRLLREYGQTKKYHHESLGVNSRLDTIQAAILRVKLKYLDKWNEKRRQVAKWYSEELSRKLPEIMVPPEIDGRTGVYHLYVIQTKKRDALLEYLHKKGVQALIHYPIPLSRQKAFAFLGYKKGDFPVSEKQADAMLSLPIYPELTKSDVAKIVTYIQTFYEKN